MIKFLYQLVKRKKSKIFQSKRLSYYLPLDKRSPFILTFTKGRFSQYIAIIFHG